MARRRLRIEPYDPDAVDGDGDGIVQEGTAWERPVGTRLIDLSGSEFRRGAVLTRRPELRVVNQSGQALSYVPSYEKAKSGRKLSTLGSLGYPSLAERGAQTLRSLGVPTLTDRGYLTVGELYGRGISDDGDVLARIFLRREELLSSLSSSELSEQDRIIDFISRIVNTSNLNEEQRARLFAILASSSLWASAIYDGRTNLPETQLVSSLSNTSQQNLTYLGWLNDLYQVGGREALEFAARLGASRRGDDDSTVDHYLRFMSTFDSSRSGSIGVPDDELQRAYSELRDFISPDKDNKIPSQTVESDAVPDPEETVGGSIERLSSRAIGVNDVATGLPFYIGVADIIDEAPNGRETLQTVLDFFNRRYSQDLSIDDLRRILNDANNGDTSEFFDKQVNHFYALLLQHETTKGFIKRKNAERLADRINAPDSEVQLSDEAFEQIIRSLFSRSDKPIIEGEFVPSSLLTGVFGDSIDASALEIYPGRAFDDEAVLDLFGWSVYGTKPSWVDREDLNPLVAMLFKDRPYVLKNNESWTSPLMLVPSSLLPRMDGDENGVDKDVLSRLFDGLRNSDGIDATRQTVEELKDAEHLIERAAYTRLAKSLNQIGRQTGGPDDLVFSTSRGAEPLGAQLLNLLRDEGFSDEQLEIVESFLGFNPLDDERYSIFFSNPEIPTTLVPAFPSAARDSVIDAGFLSRATAFEYLEDVGSKIGDPIPLSEDGTIADNIKTILDSLRDKHGSDVILASSLVDYVDRVALSSKDEDALRRLGYVKDNNGREAIVGAMEYYIKQWQKSANDANPRSLAIQDIVEEEFDIEGAFPFDSFYEASGLSPEMMTDLIRLVRQNEGEGMRVFVRAQYEDTQEMLKSMGVERLGLIRGFTMPTSHPDYEILKGIDDATDGDDLTEFGIDSVHMMRPLSSWSTDTQTALRFSKNTDQLDEERREVIVVAEVPREQIFGTAINGNGCLDEYEVVVLGKPTETRMYSSDVARQINRDDTVPEDTEGGLDSEWLNLEVPSPLNSPEQTSLSRPVSLSRGDIKDASTEELRSIPRPDSRTGEPNQTLAEAFDSLIEMDLENHSPDDSEFIYSVRLNEEPDPFTEVPADRESAQTIADQFGGQIKLRDGRTAEVRINRVTRETAMMSMAVEFYVDGEFAGRSERTFGRDASDGQLVVIHDSLFVEPDYQKSGIGRAFNSQFEQVYKQYGVARIITSGESRQGKEADDVTPSPKDDWRGGTHWPRQGFDWYNEDSRQEFLDALRPLTGFGEESITHEELISLNADELRARIPDGVYVEGLSPGEAPSLLDKYEIGYFESVDAWISFISSLMQSSSEDFDSPTRVVPADLLRWEGADYYFSGQDLGFLYTKKVL